MKVSYVVTFDTPHAGTPTPEQLDHVRALLYATVRKDTEAATHITVTQLTGKPLHPFPTP